MEKQKEYEKRHQAIQLYKKGRGFNKILQLAQRSRGWLHKWHRRYKECGNKGLKDRSRAPRRIWRKISGRLIKKILSLREELETHKTRRSIFSGRGAEVIHWELEQRKIRNIPSIPTIARILSRYGKTGNKQGQKKQGKKQPNPYFKAEKMGELHQTDLVGPRHLRGADKVIRFYTFHTIDVAGRTVWASQFTDKQSVSLCKHLLETWRNLGIPDVSQMDNEMAATGGGRYPYSISQVIRLHLLLGIHMVFIPQGEPGRNATVESFHDLWQERVLRRHTCPSLARLRKVNERFLLYYQYKKPHRGLTQKNHGARFPGIHRDSLWESLKHTPVGFNLEPYLNAQGCLNIPVAKGKVSFIRKVDTHGKVEINGVEYFIRKKLEGQYIVATVFTQRKNLVVKHEGKTIKTFSFPIKGHIIDPLLKDKKKRQTL
ncbi:MAG: hypothetical protein AYP45_07865 [Candidatus Brocadia carolinensis]|uniref:Integrase catalytic domain-containing protein n=1 Tax=Candidatus Brocadia carolinensis TaxID=1004156 RepID=A0A1V4AUE3_9BACT|nr:MAG: hypothetical protein AYP45_07865 [Candidatus Brocadia caroliniensis]